MNPYIEQQEGEIKLECVMTCSRLFTLSARSGLSLHPGGEADIYFDSCDLELWEGERRWIVNVNLHLLYGRWSGGQPFTISARHHWT